MAETPGYHILIQGPYSNWIGQPEADAALIVYLRNSLPAIIAALEEESR